MEYNGFYVDFCPFCGYTDGLRMIKRDDPEMNIYFILCNHCGCEGPIDLGWSGAIEAWNKRYITDPETQRIIEG